MSAPKHTPGPWDWQEGTPIITRHWNGRDCAVAAVDWRTLVWHEDGNCAGRESGANARLIAAAPELLEALKEALATIQDYLDYDHNGDPWTEDARSMGEMDVNDYKRDGRLARAQAAIARAGGAE